MRFGGVCVQWSRRSAYEPDRREYLAVEINIKQDQRKQELFKRRPGLFLSSVDMSGRGGGG